MTSELNIGALVIQRFLVLREEQRGPNFVWHRAFEEAKRQVHDELGLEYNPCVNNTVSSATITPIAHEGELAA